MYVFVVIILIHQETSWDRSLADIVVTLLNRMLHPKSGLAALRTLRIDGRADSSNDLDLYHSICQLCPSLVSLHLDKNRRHPIEGARYRVSGPNII